MTMGDVFAAIAGVILTVLTAWATTVALALISPNPVARAQEAVVETKAAILRGFLLLIVGFFGVVAIGNAFPLVKLAGLVVTLGLLATASVGLSGICQAAGRRIQDLDPTMAAYPAMVRGSAYVVGATLLPFLGWFFYGPLLLLASLGAGGKALAYLPRRNHLNEAA